MLQTGVTVEVLSGVGDKWLKVRYELQVGHVEKSKVSPFSTMDSEKEE